MNKDCELIFENYKNNVQLINEAVPLALLAAIAAPIAGYFSGKYSLTSDFMESIKRSTDGLIDLQGILEHPIGEFLSCLDPTGITSWPDVEKNLKKYQSDPSDENKFELLLSIFFSIPMIGRLKVLKVAWKGGSAISAASKNAYVFKGIMAIIQKILNIIFSKPEFINGFKTIFKSSPKNMQEILVAVLGAIGARTLLAHVGANVAMSTSSDENQPQDSENGKPSPKPTPSPSSKATPKASPSPSPKPSPKPKRSSSSANLPEPTF